MPVAVWVLIVVILVEGRGSQSFMPPSVAITNIPGYTEVECKAVVDMIKPYPNTHAFCVPGPKGQ